MIEVSLHDKSDVLLVRRHSRYMDFALRDSTTQTTEAILEIADENLVAPIVAKCDGKVALETYPDLRRALEEVQAGFVGREDGSRVITELLAWSQQWPAARWSVAGTQDVPKDRFIAVATQPRFSPRSLSVDPFARGVEWVLEGVPMDAIDEADVADALSDISIPEAMKRVVAHGGSGSKSRSRKKSSKGGKTFMDAPILPPKKPKETVGVRVTPETKALLNAAPPEFKVDVMEAVARAVLNGKKYADVLASLQT